jgi:hypothetical protein
MPCRRYVVTYRTEKFDPLDNREECYRESSRLHDEVIVAYDAADAITQAELLLKPRLRLDGKYGGIERVYPVAPSINFPYLRLSLD